MRLKPESILLLTALCTSPSLAIKLWSRNGHDSPIHIGSEEDGEKGSNIPHGVRKMTLDEGEMFLQEYWTLHTQQREDDIRLNTGNLTVYSAMQAPLALHQAYHSEPELSLNRFLRSPRALFAISKRDFLCPSGSAVCADINQANTCCPSGTACQSLSDGGVGCCAQGQTCSQQVSSCEQGQASCSSNQGGGCCVAGYTCVDAGCEAVSTATVTVDPTVTASPPPPPPPPSSSELPSSASASTLISTSTETSITSTTSTVTSSPSSSSSSSPSPSSSVEAAPIAPIRPTSGPAPPTTTAAPSTTPASCPTGFYACSAHYLGGCCRIGRDCSSTSCPAPSSSLALNSNGVSIGVAPVEPTRLGEDGCAQGWFKCGQDGGGGCCPSGYACGESCTATSVNLGAGETGTATVAKNNGVGDGRVRMVETGIWKTAVAMLSVFATSLLV